MIPVTRPFLPPFAEVQAHLEEVWESGWLTNHGPKVRELEAALSRHADVGARFVANGTLALQLAIRALGIRDRVLTTPFSYVATSSALVWEHCTPVFVDIDPHTWNLDPGALSDADLRGVGGIVATHVYGVPCDAARISAFAEAHGLPVLYDAAHAVGTQVQGQSALGLGTAAATSFHATKLFHTVEGGAVFSTDESVLHRVRQLGDFGQVTKGVFADAGINAKASELHASVGLAVLPYLNDILARRRAQWTRYHHHLSQLVQFQRVPDDTQYNHAYVPVLMPTAEATEAVVSALRTQDIHPRRYFHPVLPDLAWLEDAGVPVAREVAEKVLCLPLFHTLSDDEIDQICALIAEVLWSLE